ncbi:uncharacterized protein [Thunnus thynnus]|uniref:uncharacterized protein n=1 Tax=Thunnus thynnus TaxID=8237 RepID=UPI003528C7FC
MDECRWIKVFFLLIPVLQFTAVTGQDSHITVRDGDEVTLPCGNVINDQDQCDSTTWLFSGLGSTTVELIKLGQIGEKAKAKSDRQIVTANCSLVIKKVTVEDVGHYTCRQFKSGQQQYQDSQVFLSVVTMTEHKDTDEVMLNCSVLKRGRCRHTVKWLFEGKDVDKDNKDLKTSQSDCFANLISTISYFTYISKNYVSLKCNVTDPYTGKVQLFTFSTQSSGEKADWWWYIIVVVGLAALLITVVALIRWKKAKANETKMDDNIVLTSIPAVTESAPETSQVTADPEDGVSYASVSYTKKTNSEAQVQGKHNEDHVTYSTVKYSSSSAGTSNDPRNVYANVNKLNK